MLKAVSPEDQLNQMLALEQLRTERRIRVVNFRSNVVIGVALVVLASYVPLRLLGVSSFGLWRSPPDLLWSDRICMFAGWWVPAGLFVWSLGQFHVIQSQLFLNPTPVRWLPWIAGVIGCVVLAFTVREWVNRPFSGETLRSNDAWKFGVTWTLLGWAYVFRR